MFVSTHQLINTINVTSRSLYSPKAQLKVLIAKKKTRACYIQCKKKEGKTLAYIALRT